VSTKAVDALRGLSWPEEFSYRVLKNRLTEQWAHRESEASAVFGSLTAAYAEARSRKDLDTYAVGAGECVGLNHDRPTAARILETMVTEAGSLLGRGATLKCIDRLRGDPTKNSCMMADEVMPIANQVQIKRPTL